MLSSLQAVRDIIMMTFAKDGELVLLHLQYGSTCSTQSTDPAALISMVQEKQLQRRVSRH